jgi:ADP-ribosylglycohydrolase
MYHPAAHRRALRSLRGLSVGDALGERLFGSPARVMRHVASGEIPEGELRWTDDTQMALSIVATLVACDGIDPDHLMQGFVQRYDDLRGYGAGARGLLETVAQGGDWRLLAPNLFPGGGSWGNGAAMRVAPLGAWFADRPGLIPEQARLSAIATHAHPEGQAGAVAVAMAAAIAWQQGQAGAMDGRALLTEVFAVCPPSMVRDRLEQVAATSFADDPQLLALRVGSGAQVSAFDTVPFSLWCAARHLGDYRAAFWATASGLGDIDTTCAICGGVVAMSGDDPPAAWLAQREPMPPEYDTP